MIIRRRGRVSRLHHLPLKQIIHHHLPLDVVGAFVAKRLHYFQPNLYDFRWIWLKLRKEIHKSARIDVWNFHYFFAKQIPITEENTTFAQILHQ